MGAINNSPQLKADNTMRKRLGRAVDLIGDDKFLRMFRRCQIDYEEAFNFSIELAKRKKKPQNYFAKIWSPRERSKTVQWLTKMLNQQKAKLARARNNAKMKAKQLKAEASLSFSGLKRLDDMKQQFNLLS